MSHQKVIGAHLPAADRIIKTCDRLKRWRRHARKRLVGTAAMLRYGVRARWAELRGRPEAAIDALGYLARHHTAGRKSAGTYAQVARLHRCYGDGLLDHCVDSAPPRGIILFIGYARSGHSLVGSLLDAHPEIAISHELHGLERLHSGMTFDELIGAIKYNSYFFQRFGRTNTGYDYVVPGQYQGLCRGLSYAGDKNGNGTSLLLDRHPELIDGLLSKSPYPLKFIHVVRNPLDMAATKALRTGTSTMDATRRVLANIAVVANLKRCLPTGADLVDVSLEGLIERPEETIRELLAVLELQSPPGYVEACSHVVASKVRRSRDQVRWDQRALKHLRTAIHEQPFLTRYVGDEAVTAERNAAS